MKTGSRIDDAAARDGRRTSEMSRATSVAPLSEAVVLAAGEGSRLWPLTHFQPKPMIPIANRPVIEYVLCALADADVQRVVVVVGHRRTHVQNRLGHEYRGMELTYVHQRAQLGSGHALQQAADVVGDEFLVVNGDNVIDGRMVRGTVTTFRETAAVATVALARSETPRDYGVVRTDQGVITSIDESAADPPWVNSGVYAFTEAIFDALGTTDTQARELRLPDAIQNLSGTVTASRPGGVWFDPSYPWDALGAMSHLVSVHSASDSRSVVPDERVDASAAVHDSAVVEESSLVGPGCEIGAGAVVRAGSCLRENVRIGANATVEGSIVGTDASIGPNAVLRDTILGPGVHIGSGTVSPGGSATLVINGRQYRDRQLGSVIADYAWIGGNVTLVPGTRIGPFATVEHGATVDGDIAEQAEVLA